MFVAAEDVPNAVCTGEGLVNFHRGTAGVCKNSVYTSALECFDENIAALARLIRCVPRHKLFGVSAALRSSAHAAGPGGARAKPAAAVDVGDGAGRAASKLWPRSPELAAKREEGRAARRKARG